MDTKQLSQTIKDYAYSLGFDACGFCRADNVGQKESARVQAWLDNSFQAEMGYMADHFDKRCDPRLLVEGTHTIISLALNYYPEPKQAPDVPQFAYYAYGKDYHDVMKEKLQTLFDFILSLVPDVQGRTFCDTAPILERYWAAQAGIGFIGKNSLLIIPRKGSYFFLGEVLINTALIYDHPLTLSCGNCLRCINKCPTRAIEKPYIINSQKCISYQTIENKSEINEAIRPLLSNRVYGCDICQQICPWNRYAKANDTPQFAPSADFLQLDYERLANLSVEDYQRIFKGSAVKRAKHSGLIRNIKALNP